VAGRVSRVVMSVSRVEVACARPPPGRPLQSVNRASSTIYLPKWPLHNSSFPPPHAALVSCGFPPRTKPILNAHSLPTARRAARSSRLSPCITKHPSLLAHAHYRDARLRAALGRRGARRNAARTASYRGAPTDESDADGALPVVRALRGTKRTLAGAEDAQYHRGKSDGTHRALRHCARPGRRGPYGESDLVVPEEFEGRVSSSIRLSVF
jgi:hypothetical protein